MNNLFYIKVKEIQFIEGTASMNKFWLFDVEQRVFFRINDIFCMNVNEI